MEKIKELKSHAYDALSQIEYWQRELQKLNQQIAEATQKLNECKLEEK